MRHRSHNRDDATDASITLATETGSTTTTLKGTAPLASLSSFRISSMDQQSDLGSDSVFCEQYVDTDEEVAQFSSDSEVEVCAMVAEEEAEEETEERKKVFVESQVIQETDEKSEVIPLEEVILGDCAVDTSGSALEIGNYGTSVAVEAATVDGESSKASKVVPEKERSNSQTTCHSGGEHVVIVGSSESSNAEVIPDGAEDGCQKEPRSMESNR